MRVYSALFALPAAALVLAACGDGAPDNGVSPQSEWWANMQSLCGNAYAGEMVNYDEEADQGWLNVDVTMHVRECSETEIRIPLHVGDNRSRTWVLTRTDDGITLKHDHRYPDGSAEALHMYGGHTADEGTAYRQEFPVGEFSQQLFHDEGIPDSAQNTWFMEVHTGEKFSYGLTRFNRDFRADFDLANPVDAPPPPWQVQPEESEENPAY